MSLTTNRNDVRLHIIQKDGQQEVYIVLSDDEIAKGFTRPVRRTYEHVKCGYTTTMGQKIAETYARDRSFYTGTFCSHCSQHFPLVDTEGKFNFLWLPDGSAVGS